MMRLAVLAIAALAAAGCASAPKPATVAEMLTASEWGCTTGIEGDDALLFVTYKPDGSTSLRGKAKLAMQGTQLELEGDGDATWTLVDDQTLKETMTRLTLSDVVVGGMVMSPTTIQPMVNQYIVGQSTTSKIEFTEYTMSLTNGDVKTVCSH